jgi:hypothetical protein
MYFSEDLVALFQGTENPSRAANIFLFRVEQELKAHVDTETFRNFDWDRLSDYQQKMLKLALLEQAHYILRNGDISSDSGYDPEKGIIVDIDTLDYISISRSAIRYLQTGGLWSMKIKPRPRTGGFWKDLTDK